MTDEEVIKDYWKWEKEMKSKITQAHTDGYNRGLAKAEEKIADLKANFDYVLEGKDLEIKQLGERCNQLLKDKGDLTDKNKQLELIILGNQEEIAELEQENAELRNNGFTVSAMTEQQLKVALEKGEQLEKENTELKKWKEDTIRARGNDYMAWSKQNDQLEKAKELINLFIQWNYGCCKTPDFKDLVKQAEQFIKEIEK